MNSTDPTAMSSLIQKVVQAARETFVRRGNHQIVLPKDEFQTCLKELKRLVNQLTAKDVGLDRAMVLQNHEDDDAGESGPNSGSSSPGKRLKKAPITYIDVYENPDVSVGIFIIHKGCKIPLHNHPNMFGIIKCLHGQVDMTSFTQLTESESKEVDLPDSLHGMLEEGLVFPAKKELFQGLNVNSKCSCLRPEEKNYHELQAVRGPAAFIDILAPPYSPEEEDDEDRRDCNFFRELTVKTERGFAWLQWIDPPSDYFCDSEAYQGPVVEE